MSKRNDYARWGTWHRRLGYCLLGIFLVNAVYFFATAEWEGGILSALIVAFVLWTLHRAD